MNKKNIITIDDATFADAEIVFSREAGAEAGRVGYRAHVIDVHDAVCNCKDNAMRICTDHGWVRCVHYNDVIMGAMAPQITSLTIVKDPRHWPLCGKFTGDRWIRRTNGQ